MSTCRARSSSADRSKQPETVCALPPPGFQCCSDYFRFRFLLVRLYTRRFWHYVFHILKPLDSQLTGVNKFATMSRDRCPFLCSPMPCKTPPIWPSYLECRAHFPPHSIHITKHSLQQHATSDLSTKLHPVFAICSLTINLRLRLAADNTHTRAITLLRCLLP